MLSKTIIDSDEFLDMPVSARLLYYDLRMRADDDGFVNCPGKIMKTIGATDDDMNILVLRKFVISLDIGIIVIKDWRVSCFLRNETTSDSDMPKETDKPVKEKKTKHKYGEYNNVLLTDEELEKLQVQFDDWSERIERVSEYVESTGKQYKSHYAVIRTWARKEEREKKSKRRMSSTEKNAQMFANVARKLGEGSDFIL